MPYNILCSIKQLPANTATEIMIIVYYNLQILKVGIHPAAYTVYIVTGTLEVGSVVASTKIMYKYNYLETLSAVFCEHNIITQVLTKCIEYRYQAKV